MIISRLSNLKVLWLSICLLQCYNIYDCYLINDTYNLPTDMLANNNRKVRPTLNQSNPTEVSFQFQLIGIQEFDELQEKLSLVAVLHLTWVDEMISWNPAAYGNMYTLLIESESFWIPNFVLANTATKLDKIGNDWQSMRFLSNGTVYYFPLGTYSSACSADITLYPWDIHVCTLQFTPQGHFAEELTIKILNSKALTTEFLDSGMWKLVDSKVQSKYINYYMSVDISLLIERRPRFAILNMVLPLIFLAFLGNVVFLIPPESGERISYSITMLLAIAVFLTLVGDNLPKTSTPMSYFSYFLITLLTVSICVSLATIYSMRIQYMDESKEVGGIWVKLVVRLNSSCRKKSKRNTKEDNDVDLRNSDNESYGYIPNTQKFGGKDTSKQNLSPKLQIPGKTQVHPLNHVDYTENVSTKKECKDTKVEWKDVSIALDKIFFVLFSVVILTASLVFLLLVLTSKRATLDI